MQKYEDNLAANTTGALRPLSGASIVVTDQATGLPAALYSNNGITPLPQPLITDNDGYFGFYAADGKYTLTFTGPRFAEFVREIVLEDPEDDPYATLAQLAAPTGATLVRHGERSVGEVLDTVLQELEDLDAGLEYTLPIASATALGGIRLGANLTADAEGVVSAGLTNGVVESKLLSAATEPRTHTFPDKNGTVAMLDDIPAVQANARVLIRETVVSTPVSTVGFQVRNQPYTAFELEVVGLTLAQAAQMLLRFGIWNGSANEIQTDSYFGPAVDSASLSSSAQFPLTPAALATTATLNLLLRFTGLGTSNRAKLLLLDGALTNSTANPSAYSKVGAWAKTDPVSYIQLYGASTNISGGTFRLYGL